MAHLLKALALDARNPRAHYDLGMALLHQKKIDEATAHLMEALRQMPNGLDDQYTPVRLHLTLGEALLLAGRSEEARTHLARVVELDPTNPGGYYRLAQTWAALEQIDPALACYAKAMKLDPNVDVSPVLHHLLADGYLRKRQFREARGHEERALTLAQAQGDTQLAATLQKAVEYCRQLERAAKQ
jgi:tetratricopeptide (TPR) repeat protein